MIICELWFYYIHIKNPLTSHTKELKIKEIELTPSQIDQLIRETP